MMRINVLSIAPGPNGQVFLTEVKDLTKKVPGRPGERRYDHRAIPEGIGQLEQYSDFMIARNAMMRQRIVKRLVLLRIDKRRIRQLQVQLATCRRLGIKVVAAAAAHPSLPSDLKWSDP